jgi:cell division protein FtsQ
MITLPRNPLKGTGRPDPAAASRRRFARRQWLRRWLVWRYVIGSVLLVAFAAGAIWLVFVSSFLTVQQVQVQGGDALLTQQQILAAADVPAGAHLVELDLGAIRSRVGALAPVRRVDVSRDWPHGVLIKVTERTPVAVVEIGGRFHAMDAEGVLFRDYRRPPAGMPRVVSTEGTSSAALAEAARVIAALPSGLAGRVDHVAVAGVDQVSLAMRGGAVVIWGSDAQSALKAQVLQQLLSHPGHTYDVSVPGQPVTSPR